MSLCTKRLILFDFYGVLGQEIAPKWFHNHINNEEEAKRIKDKYFEPADLGEFTFIETISNMANDLGFDKDDILNEMKSYVKANDELLSLILKLKEKNTIGLLSNAAIGIFDILYPNLDFNLYFDKYFISCDHKMKKPDLKFYQFAVNSFNQTFDEIYFIDDNLKNVEVLKGTKIKGILYKNNEELFQLLNKFI